MMKEALRKYISHWALLPLDQFTDNESLKDKRPDFGQISKIGMLMDIEAETGIEFTYDDDDVILLDTVNDFMKFLERQNVITIPNPPKGYLLVMKTLRIT